MKRYVCRLTALLLAFFCLISLLSCGDTPEGPQGDGTVSEDDGGSGGEPTQHETLKLMSFNIRTQTASDTGVRNWTSSRKEHVIAYLLASDMDVICLQEVKERQFEHLRVGLLDVYAGQHFSADPTSDNGEGLAIFFKRDLQLAEASYYWLSETPEYQSFGWGAETLRIAVTMTLRAKSGVYFNVINTHLDHKYVAARENGMALILERMPQKYPTFICGDFNETSTGGAYRQIAAVMQDAQVVAPTTDSGSTYQAWGAYADATDNSHLIDFWFATKDANVLKFDILKDTVSEGVYYSDHFAITTEVQLAIPSTKK
ncbi:MAG: endonuclease/exonuclease/phosphatase family protein [Clostridia bacterium]|nr:endonuclease/exonuclease/phosphatase family protein [Clostridia bacterium]